MKLIEQIQEPIKVEMETFEQKFRDSMKSNVQLLDKIMQYIVKRKGKQMRPMLVFLSSKMHGPIHESAYTASSLIELLHTASLVHDDVVDDSLQRRGYFSVNALWKNKIAVLVGDYLLSRGLLLSVQNNEHQLLQIVSNAVKEMSEGELLQIEKARRLDIRESVYYEIIRQKTASLIAACCAAGACAAGASQEIIEKMRVFGETVGIAFQIKDDLFDYGSDDVGKPLGIDIKEKKMTLPLIYALQQASYLEKRVIINIVKNNNNDVHKVKQVIDFVIEKKGIEYATLAMYKYRDKAFQLLQEFPDNECRNSLKSLINYTVERTK
jgi:octaprenyl-diphosphate synthase